MNVLSLFDGMSCGRIAQPQAPAYGSNNPFGETNDKDDLPF